MKRILFISIIIAGLCMTACNRRAALAGFDFGDEVGQGDVSGLGLSGIGQGGGGVSDGAGIGGGKAPGYGAGPSTQTSRNEPIENHLKGIAGSEDGEVVFSHMMDLLEMCESDQTTVKIVDVNAPEDAQVITSTIREYISTLREEKVYPHKIKAVSYNDEGKIKILMFVPKE